jgi:class 3 adenylate cyclase
MSASRLRDEAKPGQILISPRVLIALENAFTVEPVGEFALMGIGRPLAAYNVLGAGVVERRLMLVLERNMVEPDCSRCISMLLIAAP